MSPLPTITCLLLVAPLVVADAAGQSSAWAELAVPQGVVSNAAQSCARCARPIARGDDAFVGLSDTSGPRTWICGVCREEL